MGYDAYKITTVKYYKAGKDASQIYFGGSPLINADANGIFISGRDLIMNPELRLDGVAIGLDFLKSTIKVGNISAMTLSNFMSSVISDPESNLTASSNDHYTDTSFELSIVATNTSNAVSTTTISLHLVGIKGTSSYISDSSINITVIRNGAYISRVDVYYAQSSSNSVAPTTGWNTTAPTWINGEFIWTKTLVVFSDGTSKYSNAVCLPSGKGIADIKEQYYKSTSSSSLVGGYWSDTAPTWESGYYIWTRSHITYTDGSTTDTTPINATGEKGDPGKDGNDGDPGKDGVDGKDADFHKIEVLGSNAYTGSSSTIEGPLPYVMVDGNNILTQKTRGINMVVLNSATLVPVLQVNYDTYSDVSGNEDLIIDNINTYSTDEYIIIFTTYDAAVISDAIANVIHDKLGGQRISFGDESSGTARRSYVFVGQYNNPSQVAFEAINDNYDNSNNTATITASVCNGKLLSFYKNSDPSPYPAGVWDSTKEYKITSNTTPMVFRSDSGDGNYYILIASTSTDQVPEDNPSVWEHLEGYTAVYAKILFADFARLGSAIFMRQYILSAYGHRKNVSTGIYADTNSDTDYQNFDINKPNDENDEGKFVPNSYIDLAKGVMKGRLIDSFRHVSNNAIYATIDNDYSFNLLCEANITNRNIPTQGGAHISTRPRLVFLPTSQEYSINGSKSTSIVKTEGMNITIQNQYTPYLSDWMNSKEFFYYGELTAVSDNVSLEAAFKKYLLSGAVIVCSDARLFNPSNWNLSGSDLEVSSNGISPDGKDGSAIYGESSNVKYIDGKMIWNGRRCRFLILMPGQTLKLQSSVSTYVDNGVTKKSLSWIVMNSGDFACIAKEIKFKVFEYASDNEVNPNSDIVTPEDDGHSIYMFAKSYMSKVTAAINLRSFEYMIGPPEMDDYIDGNGNNDITIANSDGTGYITTASEHSLNVPIFFNIGYNSSTGTFYLGNNANGSTLKFPFISVQESSNYDD